MSAVATRRPRGLARTFSDIAVIARRDLVATGTTVLLTTQYLEEADQLADRIAVIDHGRLLSEGTAQQLKDRVGGAVVELRVPPGDHGRALRTLRDAGQQAPTVDQHDGRVVLPAPERSRTLFEALRRLDAAGITPQDAALRTPTLDEVFLALTGHRARDAEPVP